MCIDVKHLLQKYIKKMFDIYTHIKVFMCIDVKHLLQKYIKKMFLS